VNRDYSLPGPGGNGQILLLLVTMVLLWGRGGAEAQIDPENRNLIELGIDQPITGVGPEGIYAYYYYNQPHLVGTNIALRLAVAPLYLDSELGFKQLLSPTTDVGVGIAGGAFGDNYYEVRQGDYFQNESFYGHSGAAALSVYQLLDPGMKIPLNLLARGGFHYTDFQKMDTTAAAFQLPPDQVDAFTRVGLRFAGKEPVLYPDLGMELSVWFERQWRTENGGYGFNDDRRVNPAVNLFWIYGEMSYAWTNSGQKASMAFMAGDSTDADRFSAWRLGGVLPLVSEFPLMIPGYYYEELTVERLVYLYASYDVPLDGGNRWKLRFEGASANAKYLPGFEQPNLWQTGAGAGISFTPKGKRFHVVVRYGYGFNALRGGKEGSHSVGLLFQYDFNAPKRSGENR